MHVDAVIAVGDVLPGAQKYPTLHTPEHVAAESNVAEPYEPAGQGMGAEEPIEQYEPAGHGPPNGRPVADTEPEGHQ